MPVSHWLSTEAAALPAQQRDRDERSKGGDADEMQQQAQPQKAEASGGSAMAGLWSWRGGGGALDNDLRKARSNDTAMHIKADSARAAFKRPSWWVLIFGWSLAACAGIVNAVAFGEFGHFVSHATGGTTSIALGIEGVSHGKHGWEKPADAAELLVSFLFGAFLCGLLIDKNQVRLGGKALYGAALVGNATLLVLSVLTWDEERNSLLSACLAAMACGLQNAMCTSHFGAIVRTTHVTGTITDIGSTTGRMAMIFLRKGCRVFRLNVLERAEIGVDARKVLVLAPMWFSFLFGSIAGAFLQNHAGVNALLLPASLTFVVGALYGLFRQRLKTTIRSLESGNLRRDIDEINDTLERAQSFVSDVRRKNSLKRRGSGSSGDDENGDVSDLEDEFEQILETMHRVEADLEDLYLNSQYGRGAAGDSAAAAAAAEGDAGQPDLEAGSASDGRDPRTNPFSE